MTNTTIPGTGAPKLMLHALAKNWWLVLLRGIFGVLFGVWAFMWPGATLLAIVLVYGAYALVDGILALVAAVRGGAPVPRWWLVVAGLLGILVGLITMVVPGITALTLLYFIAFWAIVIGVMQIIGAIRLRNEIDNEWWLGLSGLVSIIFGLLILYQPFVAAIGLLYGIAVFAIIHGILLIAFSFRLKNHVH